MVGGVNPSRSLASTLLRLAHDHLDDVAIPSRGGDVRARATVAVDERLERGRAVGEGGGGGSHVGGRAALERAHEGLQRLHVVGGRLRHRARER